MLLLNYGLEIGILIVTTTAIVEAERAKIGIVAAIKRYKKIRLYFLIPLSCNISLQDYLKSIYKQTS